MARTSKATKSSDASVSPSVVENVVSASVAEKAPKVKKTKEPVVAAPAVVPAVGAAPEAVVPESESLEASIVEQSTEFNAKIQQACSLLSALKSEFKALEKKWVRELRVAQKQSSKRKRKSGNRAPSGFVKPTRISDELASFLGKDNGTEMARTAVTRDINAYIRTNNLQDKENGRKINPDAKLASLLKLEKTDVLTYFNLQRFMSPHFAKSVKAEATA
jgi:upstream activation factor subunit UAF30